MDPIGAVKGGGKHEGPLARLVMVLFRRGVGDVHADDPRLRRMFMKGWMPGRMGRYFPCGCWQSFELGPRFLQVEFCPEHREQWEMTDTLRDGRQDDRQTRK